MEDAKTILARWAEMAADRAPWESLWQEVADYALPRKGPLTKTETGPGTNSANSLYDTTAIDSVAILSAGQSSAITPAGTQWFAWEAPESIKSDEADGWYNMSSERARKILGAGNFHTALNECFEDRSAFGLCCLGIMPHPESIISFTSHPVGSFVLDENDQGDVDTIFIRRQYSIRQLVQKFGEDSIMANDKLAKSWEVYKAKGTSKDHWVINAVFPRLERDSTKIDAVNMPWASVWVAEDGKTVISRSGFPEFPYMASRFLKRPGSKQVYGYGPFEQVKAAILDANKLKQILQVVGQKRAVPPVLIPDNLDGNVDMRPGGKTVFRSNASALPQEWLTGSDSRGLLEELQDSRETIKKAFHTDLFRMFAERDKQMTAREVTELASEKLMPFSPSFTRFTADFQVAMDRIFSILFRAGVFGKVEEIPAAVIQRNKDGAAEVPPPKVIYQSRVALALRQAETAAADRMIERALNVAQVAPQVLDNIDLDTYIRQGGRNDGVSEDVIRKQKDMDELRQARQQAEDEAKKMEQASMAADAAGKLGVKAPPMAPA